MNRAALLLGVLALLPGIAAQAAAPSIRNLDRLGLQVGGTTALTLDGDNLLPDPKLVLSAPVVRQVVRQGSTPNRVVIEVTLDKAAVPGLYNLRLANANGVSAGRVVALDHLLQRTWEEKVAALPVALHGNLTGSNKLTTSFAGKAGQALLCEVEAQRLGGKLRPVLHLYDERGRQLAWAWPTPALGGDARVSATLPEDGQYTVAVHDLQYAAAAPGNFRLKLGTWQYVDAVFPPAVRRGQSASVELLGNAAGRRVRVQAEGEAPSLPLPWANPAAASGLRPWVLVSDVPEVVEKDGATIQDVAGVPVALNGRLAKPGETDRYRLPVRPGARLRFEVFADRLGSPMDAVLELRRDNGALLARADDTPDGPDPVLDFTAPGDLKTLVIAVADLHGRGGANLIYRVVVRPLTGAPGAPDFRLSLPAAEMNVPTGGSRVIEVDVERRGYPGPVRLAFDGLPAGVRVQGVDVPAGATGALLTLTGTSPEPALTLTSLRGTSTDPDGKMTRWARDKNHPLRTRQPWVAQELAVALTPKETVSFAADWGDVAADARLVAGSSFKVPLTFTPPAEAYGGVRYYLLTSHRPPLINGRPDPNQSLRKDQGAFLELPPGKKQGEFVVLVPATLPDVPQDLAFRADLLSKDRARVVAQAFTPVRRFAVLNPLAVQLAAAQVEAPLDPKAGAEVKLAGKVERRAGFQGDVTVALAGLPPGIAAPAVAVKAAQADFQLVLRFPGNFKMLELNGLTVFATGRYDPKSPLLNRSEAAAVRVKLVPATGASKK
jgi:hypothetical protein